MTTLHDASQAQQSDPFASLYPYKYVQLTTYRKTGVGVPTPVGFASQAGKIYVMTPGTASKLKRIRNNGRVTLAPCKRKGEVLGESIEGQARIPRP
ncbi:MAG TPA: PPOX class F420-dependent oxidoreductase [Ktedonobacteraceae bacterium]